MEIHKILWLDFLLSLVGMALGVPGNVIVILGLVAMLVFTAFRYPKYQRAQRTPEQRVREIAEKRHG
jgi:hypothetical protein